MSSNRHRRTTGLDKRGPAREHRVMNDFECLQPRPCGVLYAARCYTRVDKNRKDVAFTNRGAVVVQTPFRAEELFAVRPVVENALILAANNSYRRTLFSVIIRYFIYSY